MKQNDKINSIADVDEIMSDIVAETPPEVGIRASILASELSSKLVSQFGEDTSNVRAMLTFRKLEDMARGHLRRTYNPEENIDDKQLAFTEFGSDVQDRYPVSVVEDGITIREYQSPLYASVDQLRAIADKSIDVGATYTRRGLALHAFIDEYR